MKMVLARLKGTIKICVHTMTYTKCSKLFIIYNCKKKQVIIQIPSTSEIVRKMHHNSILFSYNNEQTTETCYDMDKPQKHSKIVKETRHKRLRVRWLHLYKISKTDKSPRDRKQCLPGIRSGFMDLTLNGQEWIFYCDGNVFLLWWFHNCINPLKVIEI